MHSKEIHGVLKIYQLAEWLRFHFPKGITSGIGAVLTVVGLALVGSCAKGKVPLALVFLPP